jgi:threonine dehydrogenase-like Zn-dependent dehydrogenase
MRVRALTVVPNTPHSAELRDFESPPAAPGELWVEALAVGICGTDREIVAGRYGEPPPGESRLVLAHESLGRVVDAPAGSGFAPGDLVVGIVRHPDPVPCASCAAGEPDMCRNGRYTEHGIKGLHGFCRERYALDPAFAVKLAPALETIGVLLEPASVVCKAWEQILRIGARSVWRAQRVLVTGAGPIGLLAALAARDLGLDVHVLDRVRDGPKPQLVRDLGATYHADGIEEASDGVDVIVECTGSAALVFACLAQTTRSGIVCLTGLSTGGRVLEVDMGMVGRRMVLENDVVFGSVNANRRHYLAAADLLAGADPAWLARLVTRRVPLGDWEEALSPAADDIKAVIDFTQG